MSTDRDVKGAELSGLGLLASAHEEKHNLPQRGYVFSSGPKGGSDAGRTWFFGKNVKMATIDSALSYMREIAHEYGLI